MAGALEGKVALITGAGRGFGRATAEAFLDAGADLVLHYRSSKGDCDELVTRAQGLGRRAVAVAADLGARQDVLALAQRAREEFGHVDVLVNNAGMMNVGGFLASDPDDWSTEIDVNILGPLLLTRAIAPMMAERGYGKIINLSSQLALRGWGNGAVYAGTKGFLLSWTKSMAVELGPHGITVNAVGPGSILTDMNRRIFPDDAAVTRKAAELPLRRMGSPADVAQTVLFLAAPASDFMTGQMLGINGGSQM